MFLKFNRIQTFLFFLKYLIKISATTNGLLLNNKDTRADIIENFSKIVISLEGFETINDLARSMEGHFKIMNLSHERIHSERTKMEKMLDNSKINLLNNESRMRPCLSCDSDNTCSYR